MIVLAVDTSAAAASAAVAGPNRTGVAVCNEPRAHARVLPGLMASAAASAGVDLGAVTHVAAARGPGLFTGMRVGLVTAEMLALARGLPLAGVSTLAAAAHRVVHDNRPVGPFAVLLDARRREVFAQCFTAAGRPLDQPRALGRDALRGTDGIPEEIPDAALFVDPAAADLGFAGVPTRWDGLAAEVAAIAADRWRRDLPGEPATPMYLRRPDTSRANPARSVLGRQ